MSDGLAECQWHDEVCPDLTAAYPRSSCWGPLELVPVGGYPVPPISEIVTYNRLLSDPELHAVREYFAERYDLVAGPWWERLWRGAKSTWEQRNPEPYPLSLEAFRQLIDEGRGVK